jgi:hypothetical protein
MDKSMDTSEPDGLGVSTPPWISSSIKMLVADHSLMDLIRAISPGLQPTGH